MRNIIERLENIVKLIGKRGLRYRGDVYEAAYSTLDDQADHMNLLEIF